ncbi:hypothetical protein MOY_08992 [Halomonas sp. GFAJ-1]|nr:hypothetical protein MOY_08992 [Halomonas sp. GFAJ-1]
MRQIQRVLLVLGRGVLEKGNPPFLGGGLPHKLKQRKWREATPVVTVLSKPDNLPEGHFLDRQFPQILCQV